MRHQLPYCDDDLQTLRAVEERPGLTAAELGLPERDLQKLREDKLLRVGYVIYGSGRSARCAYRYFLTRYGYEVLSKCREQTGPD